MRNKINNITELHAEIARLKQVKSEQELFLSNQVALAKAKVNKPFGFIKSLGSFFIGGGESSTSKGSSEFHPDSITGLLQLGLPFFVNKVLFRKAGFIKRIVLAFASNQAAGMLNKDRIAAGISKLTSFIKPNKTKRRVVVKPTQKTGL
ncbi:hypothetical protein [Olivibacter sitiensis]|uniref:hypothetical protein n=1 Tax=Olivibacter sitiensis TaxID=376470 RepID=UPI00041BCD49|nr:hypothetical protein [Olivibacter sitiensis]